MLSTHHGNFSKLSKLRSLEESKRNVYITYIFNKWKSDDKEITGA